MLPSYEEVADDLAQMCWTARPVPLKKPTRKGLGRYAAMSICNSRDLEEWPYWRQLWFAATRATDMMLDYYGIRLPADTFDQWRLLVRAYLVNEEDMDDTARKALKWASR